jgi:hypothetical protein
MTDPVRDGIEVMLPTADGDTASASRSQRTRTRLPSTFVPAVGLLVTRTSAKRDTSRGLHGRSGMCRHRGMGLSVFGRVSPDGRV